MTEMDKVLATIGWSKELRDAFFKADDYNTQVFCTTFIPETEYKVVDTTQYEIIIDNR